MMRNEAAAVANLGHLIRHTGYHTGALAAERLRGSWTRRVAASHCQQWSSSLCRSLGLDLQVTGKCLDQPALYVSNHRSYTDVAVIGSTLPGVFLAKAEVAKWPLVGQGAALGGTCFVRREDKSSRHAAREAIGETLREGVSVFVFPEGTSTAEPVVLPFRIGVFVVAASLAVPVVPVAIHYSEPGMAWVGDDTFVGHFMRHFGKARHNVQLHFGPPLVDSDAERLRQQAWSWCSQRVEALCGVDPSKEVQHAHS